MEEEEIMEICFSKIVAIMDITLFLQQFLNGLSIGSAYAIFLGY